MTAAKTTSYEGFTEAEREAMKDRARELKATRRGKGAKKDTEPEVLAKIAEMSEADRVLAERIHALVEQNAPELTAKLWYGMPAYAKDGKVLCFFQPAAKFGARYATFGFNDIATLDEGTLWPTSFAVTALSAADEERLAALLRKAVA
ncbi:MULTISPECIES: iron chaperone [Nocardia]|uniref:Uncharacterized conserved protein n=1 Tax=Nocardia farcinica TaxID=37329 RepID=A0A0H5NGQ0_NOCFR|nr:MULTISPECIES: DUF1801 domain-containing protein [Nocardia]AXK89254.1 DUF1801 domain-containing protein [Nocardia farcinica]MBF6072064.1 DUF1801 domain-containing protein [Nocardia farcinica]MBF6139130.1 DUF1801 domain-containing protein [Nocardia farcinica]MBF6247663.1 DUF1801 domain-containing protein [Nocardia elegans]MBF6249012.1 DUF1801 domain-containing protein [Nocardia farcinica]